MPNSYERLKNVGIGTASPVDLIAVGFSRRESDAEDTAAREFLQRKGSITNLGEVSPQELRDDFGLEPFESTRALALIELGRRIGSSAKGIPEEITSASDVAALFGHLRREKREHVCAIFLDTKGYVLRSMTIHIGTVNASLVGPREIFREAVREGATSIIVVHNHPSGDPTPSPEDVAVTDRLVEVGKALDILVLDHVILGENREFSFKERGLL